MSEPIDLNKVAARLYEERLEQARTAHTLGFKKESKRLQDKAMRSVPVMEADITSADKGDQQTDNRAQKEPLRFPVERTKR